MNQYFNTLPTKTLNALLAGWEREFDRTAAGDSGTLPADYLTRKMHDIRQIIEHRAEQDHDRREVNQLKHARRARSK